MVGNSSFAKIWPINKAAREIDLNASTLLSEIEKTRDGWLVDRDYCPDKLAGYRASAIKALQRIRFPFHAYDEGEGETLVYQWDGLRLNIPPVPKNYIEASASHPSCILHDLAHWVICPDLERRGQPEFGLGPGSDTKHPSLRKQVSEEVSITEEEKASLLGVMMEYDLGMPAGDTLAIHEIYTDSDYYPPAAIYQEHFKGREATVDWFRSEALLNTDYTVNWAGISRGVV